VQTRHLPPWISWEKIENESKMETYCTKYQVQELKLCFKTLFFYPIDAYNRRVIHENIEWLKHKYPHFPVVGPAPHPTPGKYAGGTNV
jgi:hypothetical protein